MAVGGSLDVAYPISAPIAPGTYHISVIGYQATLDASLHAELRYLHAGNDEVLGAADSAPMIDPAAGVLSPGDISADVASPVSIGETGDVLVLHVHMTAGTSPYSEIITTLRIP